MRDVDELIYIDIVEREISLSQEMIFGEFENIKDIISSISKGSFMPLLLEEESKCKRR